MWKDQWSKCSLGPWGTYDPDFLAIHEDRGKRSEGYDTPTTSVNLMVVNDHGSSDKISSVESLLIPTLLPRNLKRRHSSSYRVIKTCPFKSFFQVLGRPFQGGNLCEEVYLGAFLETVKGKQTPEDGLEV
jgi:hypothetical protein